MQLDAGALDRARLDGILAHELSHVQDLRALKSASPFAIPRYLEEGKALAVGQRYRSKSAEEADDRARASVLANISAEEVRTVLRAYRGKDGQQAAKEAKHLGRWMAVGVFFVEFLRLHHCTGRGEVIALLAKMIERIGSGTEADQAFVDVFGVSTKKVEDELVAFVEATQGKPVERLAGTIFSGK